MADRVLLVTADEALVGAAGAVVAAGTELTHEYDGAAGIEACERLRPDVVVWDIETALASEPIGRLRGSGAGVVVVVGRGDLPAGVRALREGAEQFLARPVDPEHLAAAVTRAAEAGRWRRVALRLVPPLPPDGGSGAGGGGGVLYRPRTLAEVERDQIERVLRHHGGNRTRAARELGISRATLINKIRVYALDL
jgi:DNA-binding NtrC family response regulator